MQFVSLIETVIVFIQEVIKMMKINKLSAFILAGALTCTAPAMVYADQTTDAAVDQAVELLEQSGVDDLLSDPDKVVDLIISAKETLGTVNVTDDQISSALDVAAGELGVTLSDSDKSTLIQLYNKFKNMDLDENELRSQVNKVYDKLESLGITVRAYTRGVGGICIAQERFDLDEMWNNRLYMPDARAAAQAEARLEELMAGKDSCGGVVECIIHGMPAGAGEPVFEKLDANLAKAMLSIGAVKGFEIGDGFAASRARGSENNDGFGISHKAADGSPYLSGRIEKQTNHSGGTLGGISDGSDIVMRAAFKPTPSIAQPQHTVNQNGEETMVEIKGRHDPIIVPRAVVVVEAMAALTAADMLLLSMTSRLDRVQAFFAQERV